MGSSDRWHGLTEVAAAWPYQGPCAFPHPQPGRLPPSPDILYAYEFYVCEARCESSGMPDAGEPV